MMLFHKHLKGPSVIEPATPRHSSHNLNDSIQAPESTHDPLKFPIIVFRFVARFIKHLLIRPKVCN
jgi:hypothetical protein